MRLGYKRQNQNPGTAPNRFNEAEAHAPRIHGSFELQEFPEPKLQ